MPLYSDTPAVGFISLSLENKIGGLLDNQLIISVILLKQKYQTFSSSSYPSLLFFFNVYDKRLKLKVLDIRVELDCECQILHHFLTFHRPND